MGVYGYGFYCGVIIFEGYFKVEVFQFDGSCFEEEIFYLVSFGSVYYMMKMFDQLFFFYYNKNDKVCIIDLYQGIVWGINIDVIDCDLWFINCFDYDGDYGIVLNCFLM